jgi:hypothetical protein
MLRQTSLAQVTILLVLLLLLWRRQTLKAAIMEHCVMQHKHW